MKEETHSQTVESKQSGDLIQRSESEPAGMSMPPPPLQLKASEGDQDGEGGNTMQLMGSKGGFAPPAAPPAGNAPMQLMKDGSSNQQDAMLSGLNAGQESAGPIQRSLKVGPVEVKEEHIDFMVAKVLHEAQNILDMFQGGLKNEGGADLSNNPAHVAFRKGVPQLLMENPDKIKAIITRWVNASGAGITSIKEFARDRVMDEQGDKAQWKEYSSDLELALGIGYELHPGIQENVEFEQQLGESVKGNDAINAQLNSMRIKLMNWIKKQYADRDIPFISFQTKFKLGGSYNYGNKKGLPRNFNTLLAISDLDFTNNIEIIHDLMELTADKGAGSLFQNFGGLVLAPKVRDDAYTQIGEHEESGTLYDMVPQRGVTDDGKGGAAFKSARLYELKIFEQEFQQFQRLAGSDPKPGLSLDDLNKEDDPKQEKTDELTDRYKEKGEKKMTKASNYERKPPEGLLAQWRDDFLVWRQWKSKFNPIDEPVLNKRSKGRHNVGTRDEFDPVSVVARKHNIPIEAGRSMTTARILELCSLVLSQSETNQVADALGGSELDAVAHAIFAYWASQYNQALTPIHTYHEVMGVARHFGVLYNPFHYTLHEENTMNVEGYKAMNGGDPQVDLELGRKGARDVKEINVPEVRDRPYRATDMQRQTLAGMSKEVSWITPDGDCLYNALNRIGIQIGNVGEFRIQLAQHFLDNLEEFAPFLIQGTDPNTIADEIRQPGSFFNIGGDLAPHLIASLTETGFNIMIENGQLVQIGGGGAHTILRVSNPLPHYHATQNAVGSVTDEVSVNSDMV